MVSRSPYAIVVDDDPIIRMDASMILEDAGFRTHEVEDGEQARACLSEEADGVTLLFSDVEMPGMDGFELARHVHEHWPWIEIVIASGQIKPADGDMPPGATFIGKPFSTAIVHDHLREKLPDGKKPEPLKKAR